MRRPSVWRRDTRSGRPPALGQPDGGLPASPGHDVPLGFGAVAEVLATWPVREADVHEVCSVLGGSLAADGMGLSEALEHLRSTTTRVARRDPSYAEAAALASAWGEVTLGYANSISCEDPLTGLATTAHLRVRIAELYRTDTWAGHTLVSVRLPHSEPHPDLEDDGAFGAALDLARAAAVARGVFPGPETIARAGRGRLLVLAERGDALGRRLGVLRARVSESFGGADGVRVWSERLPSHEARAVDLLDELTRG